MELTEEEIMRAFEMEDDGAPEEDLDEGAEDLEEEPEEDLDGDDGEEPDEAEADEDADGADEEDPLEAERERIVQQNRQATEAALDAQVESLGLRDPYRDNAPIKTHQELLAFQQRSYQEKLGRMGKAAGMTDEEVQAFIDQHPDVAAAKQLRQQQEAQAQEAAKQQAQRALNADLAEIEKLMPGVGSKEGVTSHESWPKVQKLMADNPRMGLLAAFRSVNAEAIASQMAGKAAGAAKRNAAGKSHLRSGKGRGEGLPEVPADVKAIYRAFDPGMSENDMRRAYAQSMKKK